MSRPTLVVMAAGLGSRYGGLKQIDPVSEKGNIIIDYSIFDAYKAGFRDVIFIIKEELLDIFEEVLGEKTRKLMNVSYAFQSTDKYTGDKVNKERTKPLGTGHAVLCTKDILHTPFAIINADDFYGAEAFQLIFDFLSNQKSDNEYVMIGYQVENTLTENGTVSRGVCQTNENDELIEIKERTKILFLDGKPAFTEDDGKTYTTLEIGTPVSMNMFGFSNAFLKELEVGFEEFLVEELPKNEMKAEYFVPLIVDELINSGKASVKVLKTSEKWYGVTYQEDKPSVMAAIAELEEKGLYDGI